MENSIPFQESRLVSFSNCHKYDQKWSNPSFKNTKKIFENWHYFHSYVGGEIKVQNGKFYSLYISYCTACLCMVSRTSLCLQLSTSLPLTASRRSAASSPAASAREDSVTCRYGQCSRMFFEIFTNDLRVSCVLLHCHTLYLESSRIFYCNKDYIIQ